MKIDKLPSGNYRCRVYLGELDGVKKFKSITAPTAKEVKALAAFYVVKKDPVSIVNMTVREAAERFLAERRLSLSPATYKCYKTYIGNRFEDLQPLKISTLTRSAVQLAVNNELERVSPKTHTQLSCKTVHEALAFFAEACACYDENCNAFRKISFPQPKPRVDNTPDPDRMALISEAIRGTSAELPVLLAAMMSLRTGEIRGLRWGDYDGEYLSVSRSMVFKDTIKPPKTKSSVRIIKVPQRIKNILDASPPHKRSDPIYPCGESTILKRFRAILRDNNIPKCSVHELRHYFASQSLQLGIDEKVVQSIGGWKTPFVMRRTYQKTFKTARDNAVDTLEKNFKKN